MRLLYSLLLLPAITFAQTPPPPPILIEEIHISTEPEIVVRASPIEHREEYRINGKLYLVKVTPKVGAPYYLYDEDGQGLKRLDHRAEQPVIPRWVLLEF